MNFQGFETRALSTRGVNMMCSPPLPCGRGRPQSFPRVRKRIPSKRESNQSLVYRVSSILHLQHRDFCFSFHELTTVPNSSKGMVTVYFAGAQSSSSVQMTASFPQIVAPYTYKITYKFPWAHRILLAVGSKETRDGLGERRLLLVRKRTRSVGGVQVARLKPMA